MGSRFPVGTIAPHSAEIVPTDFLECNGASLLRADYADLFSVVGTAWGSADGTHFNLPDLRGRFLRGWDHAVARDPDRASRSACNTGGATGDNVGTVQSHQFYSHTHGITLRTSTYRYSSSGSNRSQFNSAGSSTSSGGNETRPINAGAMFIIRYQ